MESGYSIATAPFGVKLQGDLRNDLRLSEWTLYT